MSRTQPRSRGSAAVAKHMWKESPIKSMVALFSAVALTVGMTPLFGALGQVNQAYADEVSSVDLVVAPLYDHGKDSDSDHNTQVAAPNDYSVVGTVGEDGVVKVELSGTGFKAHYNANHIFAYWAGVGIPYTNGDTYAYGEGEEIPNLDTLTFKKDNRQGTTESSGKTYSTFYWGTYSEFKNEAPGYVVVKHSDESTTTYVMDYSGTSCEHAIVAPLVDRSADGKTEVANITDPCGVAISDVTATGTEVGLKYSATALQKHHNSMGTYAYWAGIAIPYPSDGGYTFETSWDDSNYSVDTPSSYEVDGLTYSSFYFGTYRPTLASKKGYIQVKKGDNVVAKYTIDFSNVTCVGDAVVAPLNDHGAPGAEDTNADKRPTNYGCEQTAQNGVIAITLKGTGLDKHYNTEKVEAYWAGVGIPYTNSTDTLELGYGTYSTEAKANAGTGTGSVDFKANGTDYTSIYFDNAKVKSEGGIWVRVKNGDSVVAVYQITSEITNNYAIAKDTDVKHGTIEVVESATEGDQVTVTATPDEGYELDTITATKGSGETAKQIDVTDGKFEMPASDVTVSATFKAVYTVTFDSNGGSAVDSVKVDSGKSVAKPADPTREGYTFGEWQLDGKAYDFSTPVTGNVTLKATWTEDVDPEPAVEGQTMHRLYNPNSGEHFYTSSELEYTNLVSLGWHDEGVGWQAPEKSNTPVYRLYNANGGEHHFTMSKVERDNLISLGWNDEGIGWYSDDAEGQVLYREYNPNAFANNHNYTASKAEHDYLVSIGWNDEGTAWYGLAAS